MPIKKNVRIKEKMLKFFGKYNKFTVLENLGCR